MESSSHILSPHATWSSTPALAITFPLPFAVAGALNTGALGFSVALNKNKTGTECNIQELKTNNNCNTYELTRVEVMK